MTCCFYLFCLFSFLFVSFFANIVGHAIYRGGAGKNCFVVYYKNKQRTLVYLYIVVVVLLIFFH